MDCFVKDEIVPGIIDQVPPRSLKVVYDDTAVSPGDVLTPTKVKDKPCVYYDAKDGDFYTLVMIDPDAPSRKNQKYGEIKHWLVTNIPGSDVNRGDETAEYTGSGAPKGTGLHRYIFLLYKQPSGKTDFGHLQRIDKITREGRPMFKVRGFAEQHKLQLVAGNYFLAEFDDYVPILHAQFGSPPPNE